MFTTYSCNERQLLNNKYRYEGSFYGIRYAIDSLAKRSKNEIEAFLDSFTTDQLIGAEGYVMDFKQHK